MHFEFDDEQLTLQESVRRFLAERYDFETRRALPRETRFGSSDEIWRRFAEQGFLSHRHARGARRHRRRHRARCWRWRSSGRALVLEPYLSTVALCAPLIADHGTEAQQADLLPRVAAGELEARARARRGRGALRVDACAPRRDAPVIPTCSTAQRPWCSTAPWPICCS